MKKSKKQKQRGGAQEPLCTFCRKAQSEVGHLIAGPYSSGICDECVELCQEILEREAEARQAVGTAQGPTTEIRRTPLVLVVNLGGTNESTMETLKRVLELLHSLDGGGGDHGPSGGDAEPFDDTTIGAATLSDLAEE